MKKAIVIDTNCIPLHNSKLIYVVFNTVAVSTSKRYYFQPDKQLSGNTITGIDVQTTASGLPDFPNKVQVNGLDYNVIRAVDLQKCLINIVDSNNQYLSRRTPLTAFIKEVNLFEPKVFDYDLQMEGCYLEFVEAPLVTLLPMVIPFNFMWSARQ